MESDKNPAFGKSLSICVIGDKVLRAKTRKVSEFDNDLFVLTQQMLACMQENNGIGLAAPQVGYSKKICVVDVSPCLEEGDTCIFDSNTIDDIKNIMPMALINPVITQYSDELVVGPEGCLSIPDFFAKVSRPKKITVEYYDPKGNKHIVTVDGGILSRCLQHEIDHLNGRLYTDLLEAKDKPKFAKYLSEHAL